MLDKRCLMDLARGHRFVFITLIRSRSRPTSALNQIMLITCICKISVFKKGSIVFNLLGDHPSFAVRKCI